MRILNFVVAVSAARVARHTSMRTAVRIRVRALRARAPALLLYVRARVRETATRCLMEFVCRAAGGRAITSHSHSLASASLVAPGFPPR